MTSPDTSSVLNGSISGSPKTVRAPSDHSPVRRRSSTVSEVGEYPGPTRPRLSPTLIRSFNPLDPDVRERQRTMDADMAIQLSRARSSITSPNVLPTQASPVINPSRHISAEDHPQYPTLSAHEEHDVHAARGAEPRGHSPDVDETGVPPPQFHPGPTPDRNLHYNHLSAAHDPALLVSLESAPTEDLGLGGLPMYQPTVDRQAPQFDFTHMEDFAREEKARLGILTPVTPDRSGFDFRVRSAPAKNGASSSPPPPETQPTSPDPSTFPSTSSSLAPSESPFALPLPRTRHRKLSHSNPHPRRGKLALFEQSGAPPPALAARALHFGGTALSAVPSYDNLADATSGGGGGGGTGSGGRPNIAEPGIGRAMSLAIGTGVGTGHDRPYRFSFYSNALSATIHARSLSELPADGQSFEDLFFGRNGSSTDGSKVRNGGAGGVNGPGAMSLPKSPAFNAVDRREIGQLGAHSGLSNANGTEICTWWLDVLSPNDEEMKLLSKVFNIHPLTTEDIQMEETREKIELFRNYYFVCFRGFDQDPYSPTHLEPLNMYIIVFREGILSFHYRPTPHPQNVRRRIKQLKDYISVTSDWISYALIDDITDAFGPLIQGIEYEVDSIDELVLILKEAEQSDMLRRIGTCRKKVMGLLRLMGNKADVVKGLAKRCNENWRVAPTSDIGLYLSDIQDHLITMTQNLNHYEKILSRSHSNYLAQISIEMTDANNQINDVLSKLTALGTVLIPMNLITGLWGMNVHVPGENVPNLHWFGSIIAVLAAFAVIAGWSTYRLMVRR